MIGTGDIGRHTIRIANGFGMKSIAFDVVQDEEFAEEMGFGYLEMNEVLARADIISSPAAATHSADYYREY